MSALARLPVTHPTGQYDVIVGTNLLERIPALANVDTSMVVITDTVVGPLYAEQCQGIRGVVTVPTGEQYKTLATVKTIYHELLALGIDRKATLVALGGGVIGDMTGFVAATYMRGIHFVQCPTSLLAMVDASVGGKTGVDMPEGKNLVGAFKQPQAVLIDLNTLTTLPPAEFAAGMAEVIKSGLIADPALFERLVATDWQLTKSYQTPTIEVQSGLQQLIVDTVKVKRDVVQSDPFEQGRRAVLNLGHTFGHAIEHVSQYHLRHGEAVAIGMVAAAHLSAQQGYCPPDLQAQIESLLTQVGLPTRIPANLKPDAILQTMYSDKKTMAGTLRLILLRAVGDVFVTAAIPETAVLETLAQMRSPS